MQPHTRRIALLVLPLVAAACAPSAVPGAAAPGRENAVAARRAGTHALEVRAAQPGFAYVLEVRPDREQVVRLLNGGEPTALVAGRQRMELAAAALQPGSATPDARYSGLDRRYCGRGERLVRSSSGPAPRAGSQSIMRPVNVRGRRAYCVRDVLPANAPTGNERQHLLLLASAQPIAPDALEEAFASVNERFAVARRSTDAISAIAVEALRERGIHVSAVRVP